MQEAKRIEKFAFIGAGNMAYSILKGMLASEAKPDKIYAYDVSAERLEMFRELGCIPVASEAEAVRHQTTIRIPIWKMDSSGKKYSATVNLTVNTGVAKTVQQIFQEIYESDERFPIKDIGGYNWRGDGSPSEHCLGLAIDINYNENYMCTNSGAALTGSFWRPGENPYSISPNSDVVRIFAKYGFGWGGTWNSKKDYMHFSYFHT